MPIKDWYAPYNKLGSGDPQSWQELILTERIGFVNHQLLGLQYKMDLETEDALKRRSTYNQSEQLYSTRKGSVLHHIVPDNEEIHVDDGFIRNASVSDPAFGVRHDSVYVACIDTYLACSRLCQLTLRKPRSSKQVEPSSSLYIYTERQ